jgi:hypothetical protein
MLPSFQSSFFERGSNSAGSGEVGVDGVEDSEEDKGEGETSLFSASWISRSGSSDASGWRYDR